MPTLGMTEILIIALVIIVLFGSKKIPELMKGLGTGIKEFKKATTVEEEEAAANSKNKQQQ